MLNIIKQIAELHTRSFRGAFNGERFAIIKLIVEFIKLLQEKGVHETIIVNYNNTKFKMCLDLDEDDTRLLLLLNENEILNVEENDVFMFLHKLIDVLSLNFRNSKRQEQIFVLRELILIKMDLLQLKINDLNKKEELNIKNTVSNFLVLKSQ